MKGSSKLCLMSVALLLPDPILCVSEICSVLSFYLELDEEVDRKHSMLVPGIEKALNKC